MDIRVPQCLIYAIGELFKYGRFENNPKSNFDTERISYAGYELNREQRMPTELEEVVRSTNLLQAQNIAPQRCKLTLRDRLERSNRS